MQLPITNYQLEKRNNLRLAAFTLIEILLVIAITAVLIIAGATSYSGLSNKKAVDSAITRLVFDLRAAGAKSKAGEDDVRWRIRLVNASSSVLTGDYYEIWNDKSVGGVYLDPNSTPIYRVTLDGIGFSDSPYVANQDLTFARGTGLPTSPPVYPVTVIIKNSSNYSRTITVDANGRIDY